MKSLFLILKSIVWPTSHLENSTWKWVLLILLFVSATSV